MSGDELAAILAANQFMTLATADGDGRPWAAPVWFARAGERDLLWVSRPEARHSRNLATRPELGIVVFDSTVRPLEGEAAYLEATAVEVGAAGREAALAAYSRRSTASGLRAWTEADVTGAAEHRLYRARIERAYLLDGGDSRVEVAL